MTDQTPAATLRAAAQKLRRLARAAADDMRTNSYWACYPPATAWHDGMTNGMGGKSGDYSAALPPVAGEALADWLDRTAVDAEQIGADFRAVAVARYILGEADRA